MYFDDDRKADAESDRVSHAVLELCDQGLRMCTAICVLTTLAIEMPADVAVLVRQRDCPFAPGRHPCLGAENAGAAEVNAQHSWKFGSEVTFTPLSSKVKVSGTSTSAGRMLPTVLTRSQIGEVHALQA
jgi:hypothetical protein